MCVLAEWNMTLERISNHEFKLWTILQSTILNYTFLAKFKKTNQTQTFSWAYYNSEDVGLIAY